MALLHLPRLVFLIVILSGKMFLLQGQGCPPLLE
jgi:hypothetical protein